MKIIDWPIDPNEIIHNRQPETIEEWAKIAEVNLEDLNEDSLISLRNWFNGTGKSLYLATNVKVK